MSGDDLYEEVTKETETQEYTSTVKSPLRDIINANGLGTVVTNEGPVSVGRGNNDTIRAYIESEYRQNIRIGDYIQIPYTESGEEHRVMFGVVKRILYGEQVNDDSQLIETSTSDPSEHELVYITEIKPLSTVTAAPEDTEMETKIVDAPPRPKTEISKATREDVLRAGLRLPDKGIFSGFVAVSGERIPQDSNEGALCYYLSNPNVTDGTADQGEPVVFRHALVAGSTGQGKTHFSKNILRQFAKCHRYNIELPPAVQEERDDNVDEVSQRLSMCIIDPEDEYKELKDDNQNLKISVEKAYRQRGLEVGGLENDPNTDIEIFKPVTESTRESVTNKATEFGIPFGLVENRPRLLIPFEAGGPTYQMIQDLVNGYFRTHDTNPTYSQFEDYVEQQLSQRDDINDSVAAAVRRRILSSTFRRVFDHGSKDLFDITEKLIDPGTVSVVTTGHLTGERDKFVVMSLLTHIIENKINNSPDFTKIKQSPILLAIDEAHEYLSMPKTAREQFLVEQARQAAKRGRKDKLGMFMITQNPQDIDREVRNQTNTKIYLGLERTVLEQGEVFVPKEFKNQVPRFSKGQAVIKQPNIRPIEIQGLKHCLTRHDS